MITDNYFKIAALNQTLKVLKPKSNVRTSKVAKTENETTVDKDAHETKACCIGCPDAHSERCSYCLEVQEIYR